MKRRVGASSVALRDQPAELSAIVASLLTGSEVEQIETLGAWVHVLTADRRDGWLREDELLPDFSVPAPTLQTERTTLHSGLEAVEQGPLETLVTQIEQVAQAKQVEAEREPAGWVFAEQAAAAIRKNYTFHAFVALFLYTFLWVPGLILNVIWLKAANRDEQREGKPPEGKGCLVWLLWVFGILPIVIVVLLFAIAAMAV